jgi:hypothetical protein
VAWRLPCIAVAALFGCDGGTQLLVDVRTDYAPGREFTRVEVVLRSGDTAVRSVETITDELEDYLAGERVAELEDLAPGAYTLEVTLRSPSGETGAAAIPLSLSASRGITVVITRDCAGVTCPEAGGSADATECLNARCVEPDCLLGDRGACVARCASDSECAAGAACTRGRCIDGVCLVASDPSVCPGGVCDPEDGCVTRTDAGMPDAGPEPDAGRCESDMECPPTHACASGVCRRTCGGSTCKDGEVCAGAMCVPADCPESPHPSAEDAGCTAQTFMCLAACTESMCASECYAMDPGCYDCINVNVQVCAIDLGCGPLYDCYAECVLTRCSVMDDACIEAECAFDRDRYQTCVTDTVMADGCNEYTARCLD